MQIPSASRTSTAQHLLGGCVFAAVLAALIWRLPRGIDLSDEAYYAVFIDDWLKGGIATSTLSTLHQTAALIAYPAILLYVAVTGSSDGLMLALRALYLAGSLIASLAWLSLLLRIRPPLLAWTGAVVLLAFIPFGLPAPSYNTLGQQGLMLGLAGLGHVALGSPSRLSGWAAVSGLGWAVAAVAYPSLVVPLCACLALVMWTDLLQGRRLWRQSCCS